MAEIKLITKEDKLREDEAAAFFSKRISVGSEEEEYRSYEIDNTRISVNKDGALCFSNYGGGEGFIYFYPEQLDHVLQALEIAIKTRDKK